MSVLLPLGLRKLRRESGIEQVHDACLSNKFWKEGRRGKSRKERERKEEREGEGKKGGRKNTDPSVPQNAYPFWRKGYTRRRGDAEQRHRGRTRG